MVTHKRRRTGTIKALKQFARPSVLQLYNNVPVIQPVPVSQSIQPTAQRTDSTLVDDVAWILSELAKTVWKQSSPMTFYVSQSAIKLAASPQISPETRDTLNLIACGAFLKGFDTTTKKLFRPKQKKRTHKRANS